MDYENFSTEFKELAAALAKAQKVFPEIKKTKTAKIESRKEGARSFEYQYADLADIFAATRPGLTANGLALTQYTAYIEKREHLVTMLMHESGQWQRSFRVMPQWSEAKQLGGWMTYIRRYDASAMLGVAAEDDTDMELTQGSPRSSGGSNGRPAPLPPSSAPKAPVKNTPAEEAELTDLRAKIEARLVVIGWPPAKAFEFMKQKYKQESPLALSFGQLKNMLGALEKEPAMDAGEFAKSDGPPLKGAT